MSGERGSALVIAMLVMAIMTLLGVSFLMLADTENKIAENERLSTQALYFGEAVVREVKRWFDRPPYTAAGDLNLSRPTIAMMDRTQRVFDTHVAGVGGTRADGSPAKPYYKVGVDLDGDAHDDIFDKPYRSEPKDAFVGTSDGPDIRIDRANATAMAFLDDLADRLMPGFPGGGAGILARIKTIDVYAPPYLDAGGGNWTRYGIATVAVTLQVLRNAGAANEQILATRTVKAVLNEAPYGTVFGPLHSCDEIVWGGASFNVHWGPATAVGVGDVPNGSPNGMPLSIPRDLPPTPKVDTIHGHLAADLTNWGTIRTQLDGKTISDPWFRFFAGLSVPQWSALGSPQVYAPANDRQDESNKFQNIPNVPCPQFDYDTWKAIARSGGSDVHYFAWSNSSRSFSEDGVGGPVDFQTATNGLTGLFFFDTMDGLAPHDFDAGGVATNLTPDITISSAGYGARGFFYLNTQAWHVIGAPGRSATFTFPGEPFRDLNEDGIKDPATEPEWINLRYPATLTGPIVVDKNDTYDTSSPPPATPAPVWNAKGPPVTDTAIVWGILYVAGAFDANGTPNYDGSVVTYAGTPSGMKTAGTASFYWDPNLKDNWPIPGWNLPRVIITRWETGGE